jgi:hypothetical protein
VTPETAYATKDDLLSLRDDFHAVHDELRAELRTELRHLAERIDRMQLTLVAGFMSMVVALIVVGFFG